MGVEIMREFRIIVVQYPEYIKWSVSEWFGGDDYKMIFSGSDCRNDMDYMVFMGNVVNSCIDRVYAVDELSKIEIDFIRG